jgi:hypothetical protein
MKTRPAGSVGRCGKAIQSLFGCCPRVSVSLAKILAVHDNLLALFACQRHIVPEFMLFLHGTLNLSR